MAVIMANPHPSRRAAERHPHGLPRGGRQGLTEGRRLPPRGLLGHRLRDRRPGGLQGGRGEGQAHCDGAHHEGLGEMGWWRGKLENYDYNWDGGNGVYSNEIVKDTGWEEVDGSVIQFGTID